uniref:Si:ch211-214j8.1 n=1 Tax=Sphaeramia orbicularis TaxID=375764 RepID=A0A672Z861_9TELE
MIKKVLLGVVCGAAVLTVGILIGHFGITKSGPSAPYWVNDVAKDVDESLIKTFLSEVDNVKIGENLKELTKVPHMATTAGDEQTVQFMLKRWQDPNSGLDEAWREEYMVYLSFPDPQKPNKVTVVNPSNTVLHTVREKEKNYTSDQLDPEVVQPYAAYSPAGQPKGKLVYANQGTAKDYEHLSQKVNLTGTIAITRYGGAGRAAKAINAAPYGVIGVLVYTDPLDINDGYMSDDNETYPHSWYLPPSGVERGSFNTHYGDMLTPYLAAKEHTYRIPPENVTGIPPIPIQPIGFEDANVLICELGGEAAPAEWRGAFNCPYNYGGPGFKPTSDFNNSDVKLEIYNYEEVRRSSNVMGVIRGSVEPDRYVLYGNHRDSWVHGAIDPSSGTSVMLELTRVLGQMVKQGKWRPRRSIIFGSWGAEEFGLIGSAEYAEFVFIFQVSAPGLESTSVYDNWMKYSSKDSPTYGRIPRMGYLTGAGSDYAAFVHYLGIASMDISYTYDRNKTKARIYPAYHTAYDTYDYASTYIDPGFLSHQAVARTAGNVLIRLADSLLLPFNCSDYAEVLEEYVNTAVDLYEDRLKTHNISMGKKSISTHVVLVFTSSLYLSDDVINSCDCPPPLCVISSLLLVDLSVFPCVFCVWCRHIIWASSSAGKSTFPGLADAFVKAESSGDWDRVHYHLSVLSQGIDGAAHTLMDVI